MQQKKHKNEDLKLFWNGFLSGSDDAFSKIYQMLVRDLFSFGTTFTPNTDLIKDCIQDVFIRLYQNRKQLSRMDNIKIYLLIALKNKLINELKKQKVYQKFIDSYDIEESLEASEEERMIAWETDVAVQSVFAKYMSALTKRQQEIIHYRFVEELTLEEISKLLNINYHSVANTIQRALKKMRNFYLKRE